MNNSVLIGCSVTAGLLILVALSTPGWFGLDIKTKDGDVSVSMSIFYGRICESRNKSEVHECATVAVSEAVSRNLFSTGESERYTWLMAECSIALFGIVLGTMFSITFGATLVKRRDDRRSSSICFGIIGQVFVVIGGISGIILFIEYIIVHTRYDEVASFISSSLSVVKIEKYIPYSLILMGIGLFVEFASVVIHNIAIRSSPRAVPVNGMALAPSVNEPTHVVAQNSTASSTPYTRFS